MALSPEQIRQYQELLKQVLKDEQARAEVLKIIAKHLDDINEREKASVQSNKDASEAIRKKLENLKDEAKALREQQAVKKDLVSAEKEASKFARDSLTNTEKQLIKRKALVEQAAAELKSVNNLQIVLKNRIDNLQKQENFDEEEVKNFQKLLDLTEELAKKREDELDDYEKELNISDLQSGAIKGIIHSLGLASDKNESWLGKAEQTLSSFQSIGTTLSNMAANITDFLNPTTLFGNAVKVVGSATIDMAMAMSTTLASFNKATGAGGKFNQTIDDVRFGSLSVGVGMERAAGSIQSLYLGMTKFSQLNKSTQEELTRTTAIFDAMGVEASSVAKNLDITTRALQMNVEQSIKAQKEIAALAIELGVSPQRMADDFTNTIPQLVQYGTKAISIFKDLETQSKATGIALQELIGITKQFDTFEGAAAAAGKLNALLGGNLLNSVDLLNASEAERIGLLRQAILLSGRNFEDLSKYEIMAIAAAAGIQDMATATRLFGQSTEEFDKARKAQEAQALSTKTMTEYAQIAISVQEKFGLILESLTGAALPLLDAITYVVEKFLQFNDAVGGALGPAIVAITGGLYLLAKVYGIASTAAVIFGTTTAVAFWWVIAIIGAIAALSAGIYYLVTRWDEIVNAVSVAIDYFVGAFGSVNDMVKSVTGGFFDLWDAILVGVPVVGWFIIAARKIYENWDTIISGIKDFFVGLWEHIKVFGNITSVLGGFMGYNTPELPALAEGTTNFSGGLALVGERGPEIVSLPAGANIITNQNSANLAESGAKLHSSRIEQMARQEEIVNKMTETRSAGGASGKSGATTTQVPIVLELEGRELGRAIINIMDKNIKLNSVVL